MQLTARFSRPQRTRGSSTFGGASATPWPRPNRPRFRYSPPRKAARGWPHQTCVGAKGWPPSRTKGCNASQCLLPHLSDPALQAESLTSLGNGKIRPADWQQSLRSATKSVARRTPPPAGPATSVAAPDHLLKEMPEEFHARTNSTSDPCLHRPQLRGHGGDVLDALTPFFEPIFELSNGKIFDPRAFALGVQHTSWRFTTDIAEQFIPRLVRAGFLERIVSSSQVPHTLFDITPETTPER